MTWLRGGIVLLFVALLLLAPDPDRAYLEEKAVIDLCGEIADSWEGSPPSDVSVHYGASKGEAPTAIREAVFARLGEAGLTEGPEGTGTAPLEITILPSDGETEMLWRAGDCSERRAARRTVDIRSLLPPLVAIVTALLFQRTIFALFLGVWLGATLVGGGFNPAAGLWTFFRTYLIQQALLDSFRVEIISFVVGLVALVGVINRAGGVQGMIAVMTRFVRSRRSAQLVTFSMGLVIFFDDYANTILVGSTMRPLTDRFRISREKLSYLVDSTAAPIAGLSMLSTWIAYEVSQFAPQLIEVGVTENPYMVFARTLPYRFYSIFTLVFILSGLLLRREYGPMRRAEERAVSTGEVTRPGARPMISDAMTRVAAKEGIPFRWWNAVAPLLTVVVVTLSALWVTGNAALEHPHPMSGLFSLAAIREVLAATSSTRAICVGAWSGFFLAVFLALGQRLLTPVEVARAAFSSTRALFFAIVILLLAWCIGGVCHDMGTAHYLVALFQRSLSPALYPMILFILSCLVSFSTGSSWSTMAIILPNSVVLAWLLGGSSPIGALGLTVLSIGAVLEGSIFGDHCSPISDTTILSSVSSAADHIDHVRTQIPYAVTTALTALLCGYTLTSRGIPAYVALGLGIAVLLLVHRFIGRRVVSAGAGRGAAGPVS